MTGETQDRKSDKAKVLKALAAMLEVFAQESTEERLHGYWLGLQDLPMERIQLSIVRAIRESQVVPSVAKLRELAGVLMGDARALAAWNDVERAIYLGPWKHVDFEDRLINAALRTRGGWAAVIERCGTPEGEKWLRLEFLKDYKSFATSGVDGELLEPLPGLSEASVVDGRVSAPKVVKIRCPDERKQLPCVVSRSSRALPDPSIHRPLIKRVPLVKSDGSSESDVELRSRERACVSDG